MGPFRYLGISDLRLFLIDAYLLLAIYSNLGSIVLDFQDMTNGKDRQTDRQTTDSNVLGVSTVGGHLIMSSHDENITVPMELGREKQYGTVWHAKCMVFDYV